MAELVTGTIDISRLERIAMRIFRDGTLCAPNYLPPWMTRSTGLGGYLAFSVFANAIDLTVLPFEHQCGDSVPG